MTNAAERDTESQAAGASDAAVDLEVHVTIDTMPDAVEP